MLRGHDSEMTNEGGLHPQQVTWLPTGAPTPRSRGAARSALPCCPRARARPKLPRMRHHFVSGVLPVVLAGLLATAGQVGAQVGLDRGDIDRISRAVVRVVALEDGEPLRAGSGTIVLPTGLIYTNRHVVAQADEFTIEVLDDPNERPLPLFRARLVGYAMDVDFAVLQIDRDAAGRALNPANIDLPFVSALAPDALRGDRIFVFGYPGIGEGFLALTEGTVTTIRNGTMNDRRLPVWYQTDAQISPGSSGGLAVNARGQIVGIPTEVRTEDFTGARLGGILAIDAVRAALDAGLETDPARMAAGTRSPVIEGGTLDVTLPPTFGSVALSAGFTPDPHTVDMVSGGEVAASYLGGACTGHAAMAPDFRLAWSGSTAELRIFFSSDDGGDTTLLINGPDGGWVCNDDAEPGTLDPMVIFPAPAEGRYDIWVGSFEAGAFVPGRLHITELELDPTSVGPTELDYTQDPYFGRVTLQAGFTPDPHTADIVAGGAVDVSYLGGACVGFAGTAPDVRLVWDGSSEELRIFFAAEDGEDTTLVVNLPDGSWRCNDDAHAATVDPMVVLEAPRAGQYDIWVGSYERGTFVPGMLNITELPLRP